MAGLSSRDTLIQTSSSIPQAPAEAEPSAHDQSQKVMTDGSGAECLDFKYPKRGGCSAFYSRLTRGKMDFIGGP